MNISSSAAGSGWSGPSDPTGPTGPTGPLGRSGPAGHPGSGHRAAAAADTPDRRGQRWAALVHDARSGKRDSLNQIVAELTPLLWQVARTQGVDKATGEDIVQNTWLSLLANLGAIHTPQALVGWLVTVTRREARRVRATGNRERPHTDEAFAEVPDRLPAPEDQVLKDERDRALWAALGRLPERCQELLRIVAFADRPDYDEIAAALDMPRGSIGPTRGRCLGKMRDLLCSDPRWSVR